MVGKNPLASTKHSKQATLNLFRIFLANFRLGCERRETGELVRRCGKYDSTLLLCFLSIPPFISFVSEQIDILMRIDRHLIHFDQQVRALVAMSAFAG